MDRNDFYTDLKWCDDCSAYVRYLMSMEHSYCVDCGGKVRLFNDADWHRFSADAEGTKAKGGRPAKDRDVESA